MHGQALDTSSHQPEASAFTGISQFFLLLDSGASFHMTYDATHLRFCQPVSSYLRIMVADGSILPITSRGLLHTDRFHVLNVAYIP